MARYRCFLPDLAGLAGLRRVGPGTRLILASQLSTSKATATGRITLRKKPSGKKDPDAATLPDSQNRGKTLVLNRFSRRPFARLLGSAALAPTVLPSLTALADERHAAPPAPRRFPQGFLWG